MDRWQVRRSHWTLEVSEHGPVLMFSEDSGLEWFNGYILAAELQKAKTAVAATAFAIAALSLL